MCPPWRFSRWLANHNLGGTGLNRLPVPTPLMGSVQTQILWLLHTQSHFWMTVFSPLRCLWTKEVTRPDFVWKGCTVAHPQMSNLTFKFFLCVFCCCFFPRHYSGSTLPNDHAADCHSQLNFNLKLNIKQRELHVVYLSEARYLCLTTLLSVILTRHAKCHWQAHKTRIDDATIINF